MTHLFMGAAIGFLYCQSPALCVYSVAPSIMGAYIPDFDLHYRHRKLLHNLFSALLLTLIAWTMLNRINLWMIPDQSVIWKSFMLGYLSHLFLDALTPKGVFLLYPVSNKSLSAGIFKSNSFLANALLVLASTVMILWRVYELIGEKFLSTVLGLLP
ncbi:metal-dependent hydrolase [Thermosphaera chiliense]|uniref:metal-dependent hydrolase n=1 Tax=Thermosphaera chiliense TaxID=3402707 RepID=UPI001D0A8103|nr:metal-dependent hydrolase [Thermosphaera aggregans]